MPRPLFQNYGDARKVDIVVVECKEWMVVRVGSDQVPLNSIASGTSLPLMITS